LLVDVKILYFSTVSSVVCVAHSRNPTSSTPQEKLVIYNGAAVMFELSIAPPINCHGISKLKIGSLVLNVILSRFAIQAHPVGAYI